MIQEQLNKYLWILDTITRYHSISLKELSSLWRRSRFSNGSHLPRRTFYNLRQAIE